MSVPGLSRIAPAAAAAVLALVPGASAQTVWGTWEQPLEGRRFETMRALSHYLDEVAQDTLAGVVQAGRRGSATDRQHIAAVRDFARRAEDFHTRMDDYDVSPFDVPDEVDDLTSRARRVSQLVGQVGADQGTDDDWNDVGDGLDRMRRLLKGEEVEVPAAHDEHGDYDRDYGYLRRGGAGRYGTGGYLSDPRMQQLRDLARDLDEQAASALRTADRSSSRYGRAQGILTDLRGFGERARGLSFRAGRGELASQDAASLVDALSQDARELDRRLRDAWAFTDAWADWARMIGTLDRMADLVR